MNYKQALKTLDVKDPPTPTELKKAFRELALRFHPDRNPNDQKAAGKFRECTEAYQFLVENFKKWAQVAEKKESSSAQKAKETVEDLEDIFDDIFGFTREGRILGYQEPQILILSLCELVHGVTKKVQLHSYKPCSSCDGHGARLKSRAPICTYCFGNGRINSASNLNHHVKVCPKCEGRGRFVESPCLNCHGYGRIKDLRWQVVTIPSGFLPDHIYTLHSQDVKTGEICDLFVCPMLKKIDFFQVENSDIVCEYPVGSTLAKNGGEIDFPSIWGWTRLKIKAESKEGDHVLMPFYGLIKRPTSNDKGMLTVCLKVVSDRECKKQARNFLEVVSSHNPVYGWNQKASWWRRK